jgi:hypothetical protein
MGCGFTFAANNFDLLRYRFSTDTNWISVLVITGVDFLRVFQINAVIIVRPPWRRYHDRRFSLGSEGALHCRESEKVFVWDQVHPPHMLSSANFGIRWLQMIAKQIRGPLVQSKQKMRSCQLGPKMLEGRALTPLDCQWACAGSCFHISTNAADRVTTKQQEGLGYPWWGCLLGAINVREDQTQDQTQTRQFFPFHDA